MCRLLANFFVLYKSPKRRVWGYRTRERTEIQTGGLCKARETKAPITHQDGTGVGPYICTGGLEWGYYLPLRAALAPTNLGKLRDSSHLGAAHYHPRDIKKSHLKLILRIVPGRGLINPGEFEEIENAESRFQLK